MKKTNWTVYDDVIVEEWAKGATVTEHCVHIKDSCQLPKRYFQPVLDRIKELHPATMVWQRKMKSLRREWAVHNLCYAIGYKREQTKDVDLDNPCDKPEWIYNLLGIPAMILIK